MMVPVELGLGDPYGFLKIVVGQLGIENRVAVVLEIGRLHAARCRIRAVEEEDFHFPLYPNFSAWEKSASALACSPFFW